MAWSSDGRAIVCGDVDGILRVYKVHIHFVIYFIIFFILYVNYIPMLNFNGVELELNNH